MAILSKIRKRTFVLIVVIALALFSFVLMDLIQSGGFTGSNNNVGSVNGREIKADDFSMKVAGFEKNGNNGQGMSNTEAIKQVWDTQINIFLIEEEIEKLGIRVGVDHIINKLKQNPQIGQRFVNEAGEFDKRLFDEYLKTTTSQEERNFVIEQEKNAKLNAQFDIYNNMLRASLFVTQSDVKFLHKLENQKVDFDFVQVPYTAINDSEVTVTKKEVMAYMEKNKSTYKSDEVRFIDFVFISEEATEADKSEIKNELAQLLNYKVELNPETQTTDSLPGFRKTKDVAEFLTLNSEIPYDSTYYAKTDLPAEFADKLYDLPTGDIFGPYEFDDYIAYTRSEGRRAGAKARASHVLITYDGAQGPGPKTPRTKEEAQAKANQILADVRADSNKLQIFAFTDSDDTGSAQSGGDLNFFNPGQMVPPFNDFVFNNAVGSIGLVETDFGFHIIRVTDKQDGVRLATLARKQVPSKETSENAYKAALKFELTANEKSFEKALSEQKLEAGKTVRVLAFDENFDALGSQRAIIRWAFERGTNVNDIKQFEITNKGFVVAKLKSIEDTGFIPFDEAKTTVEPIIRNQKKAKIILDKIKGKSMDAVAKDYKVSSETANQVSITSPIINNGGFEPKVVGVAMKTDTGKVSEGIEGNSGVYLIKTKQLTKPENTTDFANQFNSLKNNANQASGRVFVALKDIAKIKDNRLVRLGQ